MKDQDLVKRLLAGEERALRELVATFEPRLMRFVVRKVNEEDAKEIVQDTLLAALDSLPLFSGRSGLFSWVCGIARHEIADFYRKRRIKTVVFSHVSGLEQLVVELTGPEHKLDKKELVGRIKQAMGGLLPKYRQMLELRYGEELAVVEIAKRMRLSFKAAESGLFRARKAFALAFEEYE